MTSILKIFLSVSILLFIGSVVVWSLNLWSVGDELSQVQALKAEVERVVSDLETIK